MGTQDTRSPERLRHHYEVERALAQRLRSAPRSQRFNMLTGLYAELFERVPDPARAAPERERDERCVAGQAERAAQCDEAKVHVGVDAERALARGGQRRGTPPL